MDDALAWRWIERYAQQFRLCGVGAGDAVVVLRDSGTRAATADTSVHALHHLGAAVVEIEVDGGASTGPGSAPPALLGTPTNAVARAALRSPGLIVDCTHGGLHRSPELADITGGGARVLGLAGRHPARHESDPMVPSLASRVDTTADLVRSAATAKITTAAGTSIAVQLSGAGVAGWHDQPTRPGSIGVWPGGFVRVVPADATVSGRIMVAAGDIAATFGRVVERPVALGIANDHISVIEGAGPDHDMIESHLAAQRTPAAYGMAWLGWGLNPSPRPPYPRAPDPGDCPDAAAIDLGSRAGVVSVCFGTNERAERYAPGLLELVLRGATVTLDGERVVTAGVVRGDLLARPAATPRYVPGATHGLPLPG